MAAAESPDYRDGLAGAAGPSKVGGAAGSFAAPRWALIAELRRDQNHGYSHFLGYPAAERLKPTNCLELANPGWHAGESRAA
jgi:hypothetical protein